MKVAKLPFSDGKWSSERNDETPDCDKAQLVLGYGAREIIEKNDFFSLSRKKFPNAEIALSSSSGEIFSDEIYDPTIVLTVMGFSTSQIRTTQIGITDFPSSYKAGKMLMQSPVSIPAAKFILIHLLMIVYGITRPLPSMKLNNHGKYIS